MGPDLKVALRAEALARRGAFAGRQDAQARLTANLAAVLAGHPGALVAAYCPIRGEADPLPALAGHDGPLCLPVVEGLARPLTFRLWQPGAPLAAGAFGTRQPMADSAAADPRVIIVPLVGFDSALNRIGYGGGFYDRTLQQRRAAGPIIAIGLAFAAQRLDAIPADATDEPLDLIVTDDRIYAPPAG